MKLSIITVVYNGEAYLESALKSVFSQDYPDLEYIVIDGGSKDGTLEILRRYADRIAVLVSEPDKGLYDAMNKGIARATGDVVGILNADDFYAHPQVLSQVMAVFHKQQAQAVYGDLVYVNPDNLRKVVRYYRANRFQPHHLLRGDMPPHPTFFVRRELYAQYGVFNTQYRIVADFELMLRLIWKAQVRSEYLPATLVYMRTGGVSDSGIRSKMRVNREIQKALAANGYRVSLARIYAKYLTKVWQLVRRPAAKS